MKVGLTVLTTTSYSSTSARRQSKKPSAACLEAASARETSPRVGAGPAVPPRRGLGTHSPTGSAGRGRKIPSLAPRFVDADREPLWSSGQMQRWDPVQFSYYSTVWLWASDQFFTFRDSVFLSLKCPAAAQFTVGKVWKQPKFQPTDEWIKENVVHIYTGILYVHSQ